MRSNLSAQRLATWIATGNLAGGALALAGATVTLVPGMPRFAGPTYLLGLFAVNWLHGMMHVVMGSLGLAFARLQATARAYLLVHALWFTFLATVGFSAFPEMQPKHPAAGIWINAPDHWGHVFLVLSSLLALVLHRR
jgi:hypothetical protein